MNFKLPFNKKWQKNSNFHFEFSTLNNLFVTVNYRIYLNILAVSKKLLTCDKAKKKFENRKSFFELPAVKKNAYFQSEISLYKSNLGEWIALTD